jgi:NADH-quinone oxidoreductase subunit J
MVIFVQNPVYSVLFLVLSFISASCILFFLECEFLSLLFIIIYVGAIAVLFLFVVMMLDVKTTNFSKDTVKYFPFGIFVGFAFLFEVLTVISENFKKNPYRESILYNSYQNWYEKLDTLTEVEALGQMMYTHYVLQFLIAGLILFLALIGAVILTNSSVKSKSKSQVKCKQLSRFSKNALRIQQY